MYLKLGKRSEKGLNIIMEKIVEIETPHKYQIFQRDKDGIAVIPVKGNLVIGTDMDLEITLLDFEGKCMEGFSPVKAFVSDGRFDESFTGVPAGLYQVQITGKDGETVRFRETVEKVGVGDLWILAGQSNAAGYGQYIEGEEIDSPDDDPPEEGINLYLCDSKIWCQAVQPVGEVRAPENHGPGLAFAKEIRKSEHIPIGIILAAVGGSYITSWEKGADYYNRIFDCFDQETPKAKGIFWYQGESETLYADDGSAPQDNVNVYVKRYTQMVRDLRQDLNDPDLPVITAQLNSQTDRDEGLTPASYWYQMREIQRQLGDQDSAIYVPDTAVISTADLRLSDTIHNSANSNVILAKRMAKAALALAYGRDVAWGQPNLKYATAEERTLLLTFGNVSGQLKADGPVTDFTVCDDAGNVPIIKTEVCGNQVRLTAGRDFTGSVKVDGLASMRPQPTVFNDRNEPILAFYDIEV